MNVLVLHGPTLSFRQDLGEVDRRLSERARALGHVLRTVQTHHEGTLVDALWEQRDWAQGVLLNPGPLALGSHVLREAVAAGKVPVVEVLTVGPKDRFGLLKKSLLRDVCAARVSGTGADVYLAGLDRLGALTAGRKSLGRTPMSSAGGAAVRKPLAPPRASVPEPVKPTVEPARSQAATAPTPKTMGRRGSAGAAAPDRPEPTAPANRPASEPGKTLGRERPVARGAASGRLTRAEVRARIADRLAGRVTPGALATWARSQWVALQQGAPVESGQRELLDEVLQALFLAVQPRGALGEDQLVEWMTALE
jgi:3-dehydroquinate dehydratase-2